MTRGVSHMILLAVIGFFRAIPVLMLIFWTFFLLPVLLHVNVPGLATVVCALSLIGGAYLSHSVHAGIVAVGDGQWQAALSLGLTRMQALRHVLLPQAIRIMAPSFVNQWVSLVKDTSLAYIVGVPELAFLANQVNSRLMVYPVQIFLFVGFVYLILCTSLDALASRLLLGRPQAAEPRMTGSLRSLSRRRIEAKPRSLFSFNNYEELSRAWRDRLRQMIADVAKPALEIRFYWFGF